MELHRLSDATALKSYLTQHHDTLAALLPEDTTCNDLFCEVEAGNNAFWCSWALVGV